MQSGTWGWKRYIERCTIEIEERFHCIMKIPLKLCVCLRVYYDVCVCVYPE